MFYIVQGGPLQCHAIYTPPNRQDGNTAPLGGGIPTRILSMHVRRDLRTRLCAFPGGRRKTPKNIYVVSGVGIIIFSSVNRFLHTIKHKFQRHTRRV